MIPHVFVSDLVVKVFIYIIKGLDWKENPSLLGYIIEIIFLWKLDIHEIVNKKE